jgi:hypothetical protein
MVRIAREGYEIVRDELTNELFALPRAGGEPIALPMLPPLLARALERETGKVPSQSAKQSAIEILADDGAPVHAVTAPEPTEADHERARMDRLAALEDEAAQLIACDDVLARLRTELRAAGWVGETTAPELVYANAFTALLDVGDFKPVKRLGSLRIGGASSAGKNFAVDRGRALLPKDLFHLVTSSSEKSLFYSPLELRRVFLYYPEGAALQNDGVGAAVLRSLLTENIVAHETVIDGAWVRFEKEGPTGAVIATSRVMLDRDLENRLDRVEVSDASDQTRAIIDALGESAEHGNWDPPDLGPWHAYFEWLREQCPFEVIVPFGTTLAAAIPAAAIRLRRDVSQLFGLIWAHAVMHLPHRERDSSGRVVATLADYAGVRALVNAGIGIATGQTIPAWMYPTWEALPDEDGITYREVGRRLEMGDDGAKKRIDQMIPLGYADNLETRPRAAAKIIRKTEPPRGDTTGFLPTVAEVTERITEASQLSNPAGQVGTTQDPSDQAAPASDQAEAGRRSDVGHNNRGATSDQSSDRPESDNDPAPPLQPRDDPTDPTQSPRVSTALQKSDSLPEPSYLGELIGTCTRCGHGVGDDEWTFGAWDGEEWRFSGRTLQGAQRLLALRPLLCPACAVRVKYGLIGPPSADTLLEAHQ